MGGRYKPGPIYARCNTVRPNVEDINLVIQVPVRIKPDPCTVYESLCKEVVKDAKGKSASVGVLVLDGGGRILNTRTSNEETLRLGRCLRWVIWRCELKGIHVNCDI